MYRKDRLAYLNELINNKSNDKVVFGLKLVRGAYMEKERQLACERGIESPICETKNDTDNNFNLGLRFCFQQFRKNFFCLCISQ